MANLFINRHQEFFCFLVVALASLDLGFRFFKAYLVTPLANWCLRRGQVKWAMYFRHGFR